MAPPGPPAARDVGRSLRRVASAGGPLLLGLAFAAHAAQILAVLGFLPTLLVEQDHVGVGVAAVLTAVAFAVNAPGNVLGGLLQHRGIPRWQLIGPPVVAMLAGLAGGWGITPLVTVVFAGIAAGCGLMLRRTERATGAV